MNAQGRVLPQSHNPPPIGLTLVERPLPWLTGWQRSCSGATPVKLARNLLFGTCQKLILLKGVHGKCFSRRTLLQNHLRWGYQGKPGVAGSCWIPGTGEATHTTGVGQWGSHLPCRSLLCKHTGVRKQNFFLLLTSLENLLTKFNIITRKGKTFKRPRFIFTDQSIRIHMELKNQKLILSDL